MLENCTYVSIRLTLWVTNVAPLQSPLGEEWQAKYGPTFKFPGLLGASGQVDLASTDTTRFQSSDLYTIDTVALQRVVNHLEINQKPPAVRFNMSQLLGRGALEGMVAHEILIYDDIYKTTGG
jgi:hypothetical protein